jgi:hypothetical protein
MKVEWVRDIKPQWESFVAVFASLPHSILPCGRPISVRRSWIGVAEHRSSALPTPGHKNRKRYSNCKRELVIKSDLEGSEERSVTRISLSLRATFRSSNAGKLSLQIGRRTSGIFG